MSVKFPIPDKLTENETASSLEQWKTAFTTFAQRDPLMSPFLTANWDFNLPDRGFNSIAGGLTAAEQDANCDLFLKHITTYLKKPYWNTEILERSTNLQSVWKIFNEIFNIEHNADSLLDIASMKLNTSEPYSSFLARIQYHLENHLPTAGITVRNVSSGTGESMSIMVMDLAVKDWLQKIHPGLIERVKIEYGVQIKEGIRLSALAPQIAKAIPSMLKKIDNTKAEVARVLQEIGHSTEEEHIHVQQLQTRRGQGNRGRGNVNRGGFKGRGSYGNFGARPRPSPRPICSHCKWLADHWDIKEIDFNHETKSCRRTMPSEVKMVQETAGVDFYEDDDQVDGNVDAQEDGDDGTSPYEIHIKNNVITFQRSEDVKMKEEQPEVNTQLKQIPEPNVIPFIPHQPSVSEDNSHSTSETPVRVLTQLSSPKMKVTFNNMQAVMTIDEGSEINAVSHDFAVKTNITKNPSHRKASGAGGNNLEVVGESQDDIIVDTKFQSRRFSLNLGKVAIIKNLSCPIIMGEPGKCCNKISTNPRNRTIIMDREGLILEKEYHTPDSTSPFLCRSENKDVTVFPGEVLRIEVPDLLQDNTISVTPRREFTDSFNAKCVEAGEYVTMRNNSSNPVNIKRNSHIADLRMADVQNPVELIFQDNKLQLVHAHSEDDFKYLPTAKKIIPPDPSLISVDPDNVMTRSEKENFIKINDRFRDRFTPTPGRYNGAWGPVDNAIRFTSTPIQTSKVATPNYSPDMKAELIKLMNELIAAGVLIRPEELGITVEFLSPCLLVPKSTPGTWRLVTDFTMLNRIISRHNSVNPSIQDAKKDLSRKKYRVELDLSNYYFQFGLRRQDAAFLGVQHPNRGIYVYASSPQGLMNSSELAYDLLGRIFGDMMETNMLTRLADSIFVLGDSMEELAWNYSETLRRAELCNLTFRPEKTLIAPRKSVIFGWELCDNQWKPQSHVVSSLVNAELPKTCKQLRSYIGAYKQLNPCIPKYGILLAPFERVLASRGSAERISWTEELIKAFEQLKKAVKDPRGIYVPNREDRLMTSSDYSTSNNAIGGALHILRKEGDKEIKLLGGHFSATLDKLQSRWLACECEALAIKRVLLHFDPEIRNSDHITTHLTDNMPCVLAWRKMTLGKFSSNARITTYLTALASSPVRIEHRPGSSLDIADYASRHPNKCTNKKCTICSFANEDKVIGDNLADIRVVTEEKEAPFLQTKTWVDIQKNDPTHAKLASLIRDGQAPERKKTGGANTVLKNLHTLFMKGNLKIDSSGLILVRAQHGFKEGFVISVPQTIFPGLCFAHHNRTSHPSKYQMYKLLSRYYYTTGMQSIIDKVTESCLLCTSTRKLPKPLLSDSTTIPQGIGTSFSADVLERSNQKILIVKEDLTHFASSTLIEDQTSATLRQGLIQNITPYISETGAKVRVDAGPGFVSIAQNQESDEVLKRLNLRIEVGDPLNVNKNPTAEAAIGELKRELLNLGSSNSPIDQALLSLATHNMNTRVRAGGKTASERLMARDILTNKEVKVSEEQLREELETRRREQHKANSKHHTPTPNTFRVGDLVMIKAMPRLDKSRDLFIVTEVNDKFVFIRKSERQWRKRVYRVKPEQLTLVPNSRLVLPSGNQAKPAPESISSRPGRTSDRKAKNKAKLNIQQGYRQKVNVIKSAKHHRMTRRYVTIVFDEPELHSQERCHNIDIIAPNRGFSEQDAISAFSTGFRNITTICRAIGYPSPNPDPNTSLETTSDPESDNDESYSQNLIGNFPAPSPNVTPLSIPSNIMDLPINDDIPASSFIVKDVIDELLNRNIREYSVSAEETRSLAWDNDDTLVSLQAHSSILDDDTFEDANDTATLKDIREAIASHELNLASDDDPNSSLQSLEPNVSSNNGESLDLENSCSQSSSTTSSDDFNDLYVPESSLLKSEPSIPIAESVSSRLRSKSSCSDKSNEEFDRSSRLRRPQRKTKSKENLLAADEKLDAAKQSHK